MNARNELADELARIIKTEYVRAIYRKRIADCYTAPADAVLAWIEERYVPKPRTITTAEGLDELPIDALVLDAYGVGCQKAMEGVWCAAAELITTELVALPATVLDEPSVSK